MKIHVNRIQEMDGRWQREVIFRLLSVLLGLALFAVATEVLRAGVALGVSPIRVEHEVPAGQMKTDAITVENESKEAVHMRVTVADWYMTRDGSPVFVKRGKAPEFSMSDWMDVNPAEFDLPAHGRQIIRYTFAVPTNARPGGYRTAVLIESVPNIAPGQKAHVAFLNARIGAIIYNRVGQSMPQAAVTTQQLVLDPKNSTQMDVQISMKNTGSTFFRFKGSCKIIDRQGRVLQSLPILDSVILPQSERDILIPLKGEVPVDAFTIVSSLDIGLKELLEVETRIEPSPSSQGR